MKRLNLAVLAVVAIYLLAAPLVLGQSSNPPASAKENRATSATGIQTSKGSNVEDTIRLLTEQVRQAMLQRDAATFDKLLADDYILISGWGTSATKPEILARLKSGREKWDAIDLSEIRVRIYGDTALVDSTTNMNGRIGDIDIRGQFRYVRVWVKREGQWQSVLAQYTRIAQHPLAELGDSTHDSEQTHW